MHIENKEQLKDFRDQIQQQIYAALEYLKQQRDHKKAWTGLTCILFPQW